MWRNEAIVIIKKLILSSNISVEYSRILQNKIRPRFSHHSLSLSNLLLSIWRHISNRKLVSRTLVSIKYQSFAERIFSRNLETKWRQSLCVSSYYLLALLVIYDYFPFFLIQFSENVIFLSRWKAFPPENGVQQMENRIVGGNGVTIEQHPYVISLRFRKQLLCGAAVLTIKSGLTAAHRLNEFEVPADYSAVAGSTSRAGDSGAQIRILHRFLMHPEYEPPSQEYDVGLIFNGVQSRHHWSTSRHAIKKSTTVDISDQVCYALDECKAVLTYAPVTGEYFRRNARQFCWIFEPNLDIFTLFQRQPIGHWRLGIWCSVLGT